jgi:hypothetical protein
MESLEKYHSERSSLRERLFSITNLSDQEELMLGVFRFQHKYNAIYKEWCEALHVQPERVFHPDQIPHLPVSLFRKHKVITGNPSVEVVFRSSGTSGQNTSQHAIADLEIYHQGALQNFRQNFGDPADMTVIALLPSYLERDDSSLVYMCKQLILESTHPKSGFYLNEFTQLRRLLESLARENQKVWLIGVSFALLDFSELTPPVWPGLTVVETGGMKGRKREMIREELYEAIRQNWPLINLWSEYGMTELISQAYAHDDGWFSSPPWMRINIRDSHDPFAIAAPGSTGGINVTDLANLDSCAFISTEDLGKAGEFDRFMVSGRFDHSVLRGCNLLLL